MTEDEEKKIRNGIPVESTSCSDPNACWIVECHNPDGLFGSGIFGYYTNEFDANRVLRYIMKHGVTVGGVAPYDPQSPVKPGIHRYVELAVSGY